MATDNVIELQQRTEQGKGVKVYSLGDVASLEGVLDKPYLDLLDNLFQHNGLYYNQPISFDSLTRLLRANAHHESAVACKVSTVMQGYRPGKVPVISRRALKAAVHDYVVTGNAYLQEVVRRTGAVLRYEHLYSRVMRRHRDPNRYLQLIGGQMILFQPGEVLHVAQYAPESSAYGLPEYLGAINSLLLNEVATLFRRRYYANGAHMGFLLVSIGEQIDDADVANLSAKIGESKGVGNFKSMYIHLPDKDGKMELLPVGDFAKDDFEKIKTISRDDIISAHRIPPQILAVLTDNKQPVTGDLDKTVRLYNDNVVRPIQLDIADAINEHLDTDQQISFDPYQIGPAGGAQPG